MGRLRVTVCEMDDDPGRFSRDWERLAEHAKREESELVLLPEMPFYYWFCARQRYDPGVWGDAVESHRVWMRRMHELGTDTVLGSRPVEASGRRLNEGFVWSRGGGARGVHFKSYLPDEPGYYEASWYQRGDRVFAPFEVKELRAGFMICSDLWSMAHARGYGKEGVHMIAVPRATGKTSVEKWVAGGKVAAVLAGAYCISSNRRGRRGEAEFGGAGWVVDPDGEELGRTSEAEPFVTAELDLKVAVKAKKTYPRDSLQPD